MLKCYAHDISIPRGASKFTICVGADFLSEGSAFQVDVYRLGTSMQHTFRSGWIPATVTVDPLGTNLCDPDREWPGTDFALPPEWPSGIYIATVTEKTAAGEIVPPGAVAVTAPFYPFLPGYKAGYPTTARYTDPVYGYQRCMFVVRAKKPQATILYKVPVNSYASYCSEGMDADGNPGGGGNYVNIGLPNAKTVTFRKPGIGTGSDHMYAPQDEYDLTSPYNTLAHWDAKFVAWLEGSGYVVEYTTDIDVDDVANAPIGAPYELLVSVGHDEYWSQGMRDNITQFRNAGGNVAFFSGNTAIYRVSYTADRSAFACAKIFWYTAGPVTSANPASAPENTITGVATRNAGALWAGPRGPLGYTIQNSATPIGQMILAGTGLDEDFADVLGADMRVVGYECDGAAYTVQSNGIRVVNGSDTTPLNFTILGYADLEPVGIGSLNGNPAGGDVLTRSYAGRTCGPEGSEGGAQIWASVPREPQNEPPAGWPLRRCATMGIMTPADPNANGALGTFVAPLKSTTFNAATVDWARGLSANTSLVTVPNPRKPNATMPGVFLAADPSIDRITRNVLDNLQSSKSHVSIGQFPAQPPNQSGIVAIGACFCTSGASGATNHHIVVANATPAPSAVATSVAIIDFALTGLPAGDLAGTIPAALYTFTLTPAQQLVGLTAFDDPANGVYRIVAAFSDGTLQELVVAPNGTLQSGPTVLQSGLTNLSAVSAHVDPADGSRHYGVFCGGPGTLPPGTATMFCYDKAGGSPAVVPLATFQHAIPDLYVQAMGSCALPSGLNVCHLIDSSNFIHEVAYREGDNGAQTVSRFLGDTVKMCYSAATFFSKTDGKAHVVTSGQDKVDESMELSYSVRDTFYAGPGTYGGAGNAPSQLLIASSPEAQAAERFYVAGYDVSAAGGTPGTRVYAYASGFNGTVSLQSAST